MRPAIKACKRAGQMSCSRTFSADACRQRCVQVALPSSWKVTLVCTNVCVCVCARTRNVEYLYTPSIVCLLRLQWCVCREFVCAHKSRVIHATEAHRPQCAPLRRAANWPCQQEKCTLSKKLERKMDFLSLYISWSRSSRNAVDWTRWLSHGSSMVYRFFLYFVFLMDLFLLCTWFHPNAVQKFQHNIPICYKLDNRWTIACRIEALYTPVGSQAARWDSRSARPEEKKWCLLGNLKPWLQAWKPVRIYASRRGSWGLGCAYKHS